MKKIKIIALLMLVSLSYMACNKCEEVELKKCGGTGSVPMIDLIVLMDQSGSMGPAADSVSMAAMSAIDSALLVCPSDLRYVFLGVDGVTWPTTLFNTSHRNYLYFIHSPSLVLSADQNNVGSLMEQGANAIEDLSNFYDWRLGACRAIFYISDEELDSILPTGDFANEDQVTQAAILAAQNNNVTVFNHFIDHQGRAPQIKTNYFDLANDTGGTSYYSTSQNVPRQFYKTLMPDIICNACNGCNLNGFMNSN